MIAMHLHEICHYVIQIYITKSVVICSKIILLNTLHSVKNQLSEVLDYRILI